MRGKLTPLMVIAAITVFGMAAFARQAQVCHPRVRAHVSHRAHVSKCLTRGVAITVDGNSLVTSERPRMVNGRVMLPMRSAFEGLGATVSWEPARRRAIATKGDRQIALTVGSRSATVNGRTVRLEAAPRMYRDVVYVPLRAVSESLGATVAWYPSRCQVAITMPPAPVAVAPPPVAVMPEAPPVEVAPPPAPVAIAPQPLTGTCIVVNGCILTTSAMPVMIGNTVMVPALPVFTQLRAQPIWNAGNGQFSARIGGQQAILTVGSNTAIIGGQTVQLSEAPMLYEGRLYVPLDFVGSAFGGTATYAADRSQIVISTQGVPVG